MNAENFFIQLYKINKTGGRNRLTMLFSDWTNNEIKGPHMRKAIIKN
jgi:hypothetical protein